MTETTGSRVAFLRERVEAARAAHGPTWPVPFRQGQRDLPRIEVPIEFPLYRLQSGRTHRAQAQYVDRHGLAADFFADPESEEAQLAQHEILLELIDEGNLRQDLAERDQRAAIVLTYDGFIVDGNRRTAALRDAEAVENLTAVVLPEDATASDFYETELELQMARDTKARYNWIDQALHIRWGVQELDESMAAIARRMNMAEKDVEELLGLLVLVDLYLEWLGAPGKYHRVTTDERSETRQSFLELYLRERRPRFRSLPELQQRAVRHACFTVIRQDGGYKDIRRVADTIIGQPARVVERLRDELSPHLQERLDEPLEVEQAAEPAGEGSDLLDELAASDQPVDVPDGAQLLNLVDEAEHAEQVAKPLCQVAEDLTELENERREQGEPLRKVERALRALQDVELTAETPRLADIARSLEAVMKRSEELSEQVDDLRSTED